MDTPFHILKFYFYYWKYSFTGFPLVFYITSFFIVVLTMLYIYSLLGVFYTMYVLKREKILSNRIEYRYKEKMEAILFMTQDICPEEIESRLEVKSDSLSKWEKKQVTNLLLSIKTGRDAVLNVNNYLGVVEVFSLLNYWESLLYAKNLRKNMMALRKLDYLGVNISDSILVNKVQEFNHDLRKHVKSEHLRFARHDPFKFLEGDFDRELNPLDQIRIHVALKERSKNKPLPPLMRWVYSTKNIDYKCFLIKEIGLFNQVESAPQLMELYQTSKNSRVKANIAEALGVLKYNPAVSSLSASFNSVPEFVQLAIINTMGVLGTEEALKVLVELYKQNPEDEVFIKVVQNIFKIDTRKETYLKLKDVATNIFQKSVFAQAEQDR